jgi:hypothetical protein
MAANIQDVIMLFGDSITQGGWEEGAFGHKLSRTNQIDPKGIWTDPFWQTCTPGSSMY